MNASLLLLHATPQCVVRQGQINHKYITRRVKRNAILCRPRTTEDILAVRDELALLERSKGKQSLDDAWGAGGNKAMREKEVDVYGHLAFAAISGHALFILGTNSKTFIHFSKVFNILDESDLRSPCHFTIVGSSSITSNAKQEFRFVCDTSPEYQHWITALRQAFDEANAHDFTRSRSRTRPRSTSRSSVVNVKTGSNTPRPSSRSSMVRNEAPRSSSRSSMVRSESNRPSSRNSISYDGPVELTRTPSRNSLNRPPSSARARNDANEHERPRRRTPSTPRERSRARNADQPAPRSRSQQQRLRSNRSSRVATPIDTRPPSPSRHHRRSRRPSSEMFSPDKDVLDSWKFEADNAAVKSKTVPRVQTNEIGPDGQPVRSSMRQPTDVSESGSERASTSASKPESNAKFGDAMTEVASAVSGPELASTSSLRKYAEPEATESSDTSTSRRVRRNTFNNARAEPGLATRSGSLVRFSTLEERVLISPSDPSTLATSKRRVSTVNNSNDLQRSNSATRRSSDVPPTPVLTRRSSYTGSTRSNSSGVEPRRRHSSVGSDGYGRSASVSSALQSNVNAAQSKRMSRSSSVDGLRYIETKTTATWMNDTDVDLHGVTSTPTPAPPVSQLEPLGKNTVKEKFSFVNLFKRSYTQSSPHQNARSQSALGNITISPNTTSNSSDKPESHQHKETSNLWSSFTRRQRTSSNTSLATMETVNSTHSGPKLLASLMLVPSVRVPPTDSLSSMIRSSAKNLEQELAEDLKSPLSPKGVWGGGERRGEGEEVKREVVEEKKEVEGAMEVVMTEKTLVEEPHEVKEEPAKEAPLSPLSPTGTDDVPLGLLKSKAVVHTDAVPQDAAKSAEPEVSVQPSSKESEPSIPIVPANLQVGASESLSDNVEDDADDDEELDSDSEVNAVDPTKKPEPIAKDMPEVTEMIDMIPHTETTTSAATIVPETSYSAPTTQEIVSEPASPEQTPKYSIKMGRQLSKTGSKIFNFVKNATVSPSRTHNNHAAPQMERTATSIPPPSTLSTDPPSRPTTPSFTFPLLNRKKSGTVVNSRPPSPPTAPVEVTPLNAPAPKHDSVRFVKRATATFESWNHKIKHKASTENVSQFLGTLKRTLSRPDLKEEGDAEVENKQGGVLTLKVGEKPMSDKSLSTTPEPKSAVSSNVSHHSKIVDEVVHEMEEIKRVMNEDVDVGRVEHTRAEKGKGKVL
ncbi:hypothetical protein HDV05_000303 [Chytridiales sp. JEL 0842]|nr:hypothetical protein HDV05_000303 [Chytridiales sp. JEL 0842]